MLSGEQGGLRHVLRLKEDCPSAPSVRTFFFFFSPPFSLFRFSLASPRSPLYPLSALCSFSVMCA